MVRCALVALVAGTTGCVSLHQTYAPDGRKTYTLNCNGSGLGWDKCMAAASDLCGPAGYDVLDRRYQGILVSGPNVDTSSGSGFVVNTHERSMLVACKGAS